MRGVMKTAVKRGMIAANPCDGIELPSKRAAQSAGGERLYLSAAEVRQLADAMPEHWRLATLVAALCGLRAGELWALRRCDVDPLHGTMRVRYALKEVSGSIIAGATKTSTERTFKVPPSLLPELTAALAAPGKRLRKVRTAGAHGYPAIVAGELTWTDDPSNADRLLFTTVTGHPVQHSNFFRRAFRPAVEQLWPAGHRLRPLRWHDLRHTAASLNLAATGGNLHAVKELLGHSSIVVTVDRYGGLVLPSVDSDRANALDAMFDTSATATSSTNVVELPRTKEA